MNNEQYYDYILQGWVANLIKRSDPANIRDYSYYGDSPLGTQAFKLFRQTRDSGCLERSNFEVITADLMERFPDDCNIERDNHWAV